jgi:Cu+-exporting ATPase
MASPIAIICGIGIACSKGILIKNSKVLEGLHKVNIVCFDKTGTLTQGRPDAVDEYIFERNDNNDYNNLFTKIVLLEKKSTHPLSMAVINRITGCATEYVYKDYGNVSKDTMLKDYTIIEGHGIQGCINGEIIKIVN